MMDYRVRRSLRTTRYRPGFADGQPFGIPQHSYRHEFLYYRRVPESAQSQGPTSDATDSGAEETQNEVNGAATSVTDESPESS